MRKQILAIALGGMLALGAQSAIYAQDNSAQQDSSGAQQQGQGHRHGMDPDRQLEHMTKTLDLTSDQQSQIRPLLVDHQQKMQALWQNQSLSREDRRSQMQSIQQNFRTQVEAVLNGEQKQKFEAMQERMHHRGQMGGENEPSTTSPQPQ